MSHRKIENVGGHARVRDTTETEGKQFKWGYQAGGEEQRDSRLGYKSVHINPERQSD